MLSFNGEPGSNWANASKVERIGAARNTTFWGGIWDSLAVADIAVFGAGLDGKILCLLKVATGLDAADRMGLCLRGTMVLSSFSWDY